MILIALCFILLCYLGVMVIRLIRFSRASKRAETITEPYMRELPGSSEHVLVLGDSTMYGAGIEDPAHTIGGLLAAKYIAASIETLAVSGAKIADLPDQLGVARHESYKLVVIGIGGNDIVRFTNYDAVEHNLTAFLQTISERADQIVLCHSVNVGNIGFFLFPFNYIFASRSRRLSQVYEKVTENFPKVRYANFYRPLGNDHYTKQTRPRFIAKDGFHPSDYANQYFFDLIWKEINKP